MAVADENTRVQVTMPKTLRKELEKEAKQENRSLSNYIVKILLDRNQKPK
ncbi:ribbon-helix-helix domain-containing protein [Thermoflavimicrobium daqui]|uniref:DNA-binding protein n=1 Tax=Thermoflavimicrobium daqui TaxID=2137476 RepID=A0A364K1U4_9BACL|nr:DNA-binding protein [Thermoflavimicrobium daqui]RAL22002.1 DNA-binding protein [Thermoflavimicrobium daqui]